MYHHNKTVSNLCLKFVHSVWPDKEIELLLLQVILWHSEEEAAAASYSRNNAWNSIKTFRHEIRFKMTKKFKVSYE